MIIKEESPWGIQEYVRLKIKKFAPISQTEYTDSWIDISMQDVRKIIEWAMEDINNRKGD